MQRTTLAFLWHMHQPYYRDMVTGESTMPWVRLHAIHSYYDMLKLYEKFPGVNGTVNFVPSLMDQLLSYAEGGKGDAFLEHTLVPAEELSPTQKAFLLRNFFMANPEHKIAPYVNYQRLYARRGLDLKRIDFQQAIRFFSTQDYLDLQVYYNLVWFGFAAREEIPEINQLLLHGGHFTEADKLFVIEAQKRIIRSLIETIRRAAASQNVEICTSPYYHPIFPLLLDSSYALRCTPKAILPPSVKIPNVAAAQIKNALDSMEKWTGKRPRGIWPAEGSVCPEEIPIFADLGAAWMATDDRVLARSLPKGEKDVSPHQPFTATFGGKSVGMVFRDHNLSDLISFTYSKMPAQAAAADFLQHIKAISAHAKGEDRLVTIILDGENPWEFYPESGKQFLTALFTEIEREGVPTATIGGYIDANPPKKTITELYTASWIDANFNIWIGKPQKNSAWNYIKRTLDELGDAISPALCKENADSARAFESLCAACGSDWFWWYDDDFDSAFKPDFDRLFRQHLKNAFTILGRDIPIYLFEPIYRFTDIRDNAEPVGFMEPTIDGKRSSFFEWANAIRYNVHGRGGAMAMGTERFETISFGFNAEAFFLRIDPVDSDAGFSMPDGDKLVIYVHDGGTHFKFAISRGENGYGIEKISSDGFDSTVDVPIRLAVCNVLELGVPYAPLKFKPGEQITVAIVLNRHGVEVRRYSHIRFSVPDETYEQRMWSV